MVAYGARRRSPGRQPHAGSKNHERQILEAQAILARHIAGEHASAEETIAKLMQLLDSTELVKALAQRGFSSKALERDSQEWRRP
jgi:hypothetical protein